MTNTDFDLLVDNGYPKTLAAICHSAYRQTSEPLCGLIPILLQLFDQEMPGMTRSTKPDFIPFSLDGASIPLWALDCYTREGKTALQAILKPDNAVYHWLSTHIPKRSQTSTLCSALFRVEGGLVDHRLMWPSGMDFRKKMDLTRWNIPEDKADQLLNILRLELPTLNSARRMVWDGREI